MNDLKEAMDALESWVENLCNLDDETECLCEEGGRIAMAAVEKYRAHQSHLAEAGPLGEAVETMDDYCEVCGETSAARANLMGAIYADLEQQTRLKAAIERVRECKARYEGDERGGLPDHWEGELMAALDAMLEEVNHE